MMQRVSKGQNKKGLTLIEVLFSMTILVIAIMPLALMLAANQWGGPRKYGALNLGKRQANLNRCLFLAERTLDELKSIAVSNWSDARVQNGTSPVITYDTDSGFVYSTDISDTVANGGVVDRVKRLRITVWKEEISPATYPPADLEDSVTLYTRVVTRDAW